MNKLEKDEILDAFFKNLKYKTLCFPGSKEGYEIKRPYFVMELSEVKKFMEEGRKKKFEKGQECTLCGKPDKFSDETMCHACINKWKLSLYKKERDRILGLIDEYDDIYGLIDKKKLVYMVNNARLPDDAKGRIDDGN